jgi:hypothetical protein
MKFDFIEKTNSNVVVIGDKEQLVVSNFSYQTSVKPTNTKEFRFKVIDQDQALRRINADNDELYINGALQAVTDGYEIYDLVAIFFQNKVTA